jgi:hypothetical protein
MSMGTLKWVINLHLLPIITKIKDFLMEQLKFELIMSQIMEKHKQHVKNIMLERCELNRNMILTKLLMLKCYLENWLKKNTNYIKMM